MSWTKTVKNHLTGGGSAEETRFFAGLGFSTMAQRFAIHSRAEAQAYLAHGVLGPRLFECTRLVLAVKNRTIHDILGSPDDMKFRSSMTLFDAVSENPMFAQAISAYYGGEPDRATLDRLEAMDSERPPG